MNQLLVGIVIGVPSGAALASIYGRAAIRGLQTQVQDLGVIVARGNASLEKLLNRGAVEKGSQNEIAPATTPAVASRATGALNQGSSRSAFESDVARGSSSANRSGPDRTSNGNGAKRPY